MAMGDRERGLLLDRSSFVTNDVLGLGSGHISRT